MGKRRIKQSVKLLCILISLLIIGITGCEKKAPVDDKQEKKTENSIEKKQDKAGKEKKAQRIPDDLLPGGEGTSGSADDTSLDMDTLEEGETEASANDNSARSSSGGASGNTSSDNEESRGETGTVSNEITVSFDVESSNAEQYGYAVYYSTTLNLKRGMTVYDALAASGVAYSGKSYITSIGGLAEKTGVGTAGWKYYINGNEPGVSCNKYTLQDGDLIQWSYVLKP